MILDENWLPSPLIDMEWTPTFTFPRKPTEIVEGVWIGDRIDARAAWGRPGWTVIDVRESDTEKDPESVVRIPLLRAASGQKAGQQALLEITEAIDKARARGDNVLVHCWQGLERSPLSVACWLVISRGYTFDDAYDLVRSKRGAWDRREWLTNKMRRSLGVTLVTADPFRDYLALLQRQQSERAVGDSESLREGD